MLSAKLGLEEVLAVTNSLTHIMLCTELVSIEQKVYTFEFLCAVCLLTEDSWK